MDVIAELGWMLANCDRGGPIDVPRERAVLTAALAEIGSLRGKLKRIDALKRYAISPGILFDADPVQLMKASEVAAILREDP